MARQPATDTPQLSVIVLVFNEVDSVEPLHRELVGVVEALGRSFEVVYIDDGSRDGSTERLGQLASRDGRVRVVSFRRNFGQTAAGQARVSRRRHAERPARHPAPARKDRRGLRRGQRVAA